jgi:hypothetical protein
MLYGAVSFHMAFDLEGRLPTSQKKACARLAAADDLLRRVSHSLHKTIHITMGVTSPHGCSWMNFIGVGADAVLPEPAGAIHYDRVMFGKQFVLVLKSMVKVVRPQAVRALHPRRPLGEGFGSRPRRPGGGAEVGMRE